MRNRALFTVIFALLGLIVFAAGGKPGTVTGRATDAGGKPLAGVKIWVKPVVTTGLYETRTDAQGRYEATGLPPVGYRVMGWFEKEYRGQRFCLRLGHKSVEEYSPVNPAQGATRDLVWRTSGRIEDVELYSDMGYFGGSVSVMSEMNVSARNQPLEFTLTPTAPLIDGSQGKTLTRKPSADGYLLDIPVGVYKVTARLNGKPVRLGSTSDSLGAQATLEFKPGQGSCVGNSSSGVGRAYLYWAAGGSTSSGNAGNANTNLGGPNGDGLIPVDVPVTTAKDGMEGVWQGSITVKGGDTYLVRYVITDMVYAEGYVAIEGEFFECDSAGECEKIGTMRGKRVAGAGADFTTTLDESGASFQAVGHFEGRAFVGLTEAVFEGKEAVLRLTPR